jgi:hypothetical protein
MYNALLTQHMNDNATGVWIVLLNILLRRDHDEKGYANVIKTAKTRVSADNQSDDDDAPK